MKVGYAVLYENGKLVISKNHTLLQKIIIKDYGEFEDINVPWKNEYSQIKKVQILDQVKSNYMKKWFIHCNHLTTLIDFKNLNVFDCVDFSNMFAYCKSLQDLNGVQKWNVSNGTNFSDMFYNCNSLQNLNRLEKWNVSKGIDFSDMFTYCESLKEISLPNSMKYLNRDMFFNCNEDLKIHWKKYTYTYADLLEYEKIY